MINHPKRDVPSQSPSELTTQLSSYVLLFWHQQNEQQQQDQEALGSSLGSFFGWEGGALATRVPRLLEQESQWFGHNMKYLVVPLLSEESKRGLYICVLQLCAQIPPFKNRVL